MASETVDPIDWSHPPPYTGQYPLISTYCTVQCGLQITRLTALTEMRTCDLRNARPTHSLCGHSGYILILQYSINSNFNTPLFNHSKTQKCYLYQVIPIWNSLPSSLKNCTSNFTFKKQMKSHLLASQS